MVSWEGAGFEQRTTESYKMLRLLSCKIGFKAMEEGSYERITQFCNGFCCSARRESWLMKLGSSWLDISVLRTTGIGAALIRDRSLKQSLSRWEDWCVVWHYSYTNIVTHAFGTDCQFRAAHQRHSSALLWASRKIGHVVILRKIVLQHALMVSIFYEKYYVRADYSGRAV